MNELGITISPMARRSPMSDDDPMLRGLTIDPHQAAAAMDEALEQARLAAELGETPVGAVIVHEGRTIAAAHNRREIDQDPTAHAEMIALRQAAAILGSWRLEGCLMAVTLEPCPMCAGALVNARLPMLVYGAADPKMGCVHTLHALCSDRRFNHRLCVLGGVGAQASADLLQAFFQARRQGVAPPKPGRGSTSA